MIDPAMLRNQRFGKHLFVPLPDEDSRFQILQTLARKTRLHPSVNLKTIATRCLRFSGADLAGLIREASVTALSKHLDSSDLQTIFVKNEDFEDAFKKVNPSVSAEEEKKYLTLQTSLLEQRMKA
jgi:ribosome biogenesis ATPase